MVIPKSFRLTLPTRLNLTPLAYLWQRDQDELIEEMVGCKIDAILIKVAALGLEPAMHLGKSITELKDHLRRMAGRFGNNVCGEGNVPANALL